MILGHQSAASKPGRCAVPLIHCLPRGLRYGWDRGDLRPSAHKPDAVLDTHSRHQRVRITWPAIRRVRAIFPGRRLHRTTVRHLLSNGSRGSNPARDTSQDSPCDGDQRAVDTHGWHLFAVRP